MITVQSNLSEVTNAVAAKIINFESGATGYNAMLFNVSSVLLYDVKNRIHRQGLAADGSRIGVYSKKPIYVSINKGVGTPVGKTGYNKFNSGKRKGRLHTSRYFPEGYHQYKATLGKNVTGSVNLEHTGMLNQQFSLILATNGYGLGWTDNSLLPRAKALEDKYGKKIWSLTTAESSKVISTAKQFIANAIS